MYISDLIPQCLGVNYIMHLIGMLSCIKHISYYLIKLFINNYKLSSKIDVPCYILLMFFYFRVVKVHILFQKIFFNLVSFKKHLIFYLK